LNCDSGKMRDKRATFGGRTQARSALHRATLSAARFDPALKAALHERHGKTSNFMRPEQ
jgi:transposase